MIIDPWDDNWITRNFQSESKKSGDQFESLVYKDLEYRGFTDIKKNVYIDGAGCEVDFLTYKDGQPVEYVESKGGKSGDKKRPGAQRTDNVKKAIANGALIKKILPEIYYVVYFSALPFADSYSEEMLDVALRYGIINEVRYLLDKDNIVKETQ